LETALSSGARSVEKEDILNKSEHETWKTILISTNHRGQLLSLEMDYVFIWTHQGLHSLPFWTLLIPPYPSRVTFTAILDLAHSTLDPPRVTFIAILDLAQSTLDPSRVTFIAILDLAQSTLDPSILDPSRVTFTAILDLAHSTLDTNYIVFYSRTI
jgi:hypothetical protein